MSKFQEKFKKNLSDMWRVIKRDKVYVILLMVLVAIATVNIVHHTNQPDTAKSIKTKSTQSTTEDMDNLLKDFKMTPLFKKLLTVMMIGLVAGILMLGFNFVRFMKRYFFMPQEDNPPDKTGVVNYRELYPWSLWDVAKILIIFFTSYLCFLTIQELVITFAGADSDSVNYEFLSVLDMLFSEIVAVFFLFRFMGNYNVSFNRFGFKSANFFASVWKGLSSYLMFLPVYIVLVLLTSMVSKMLDMKLKPQEVFSLLTDESKFSSSQFMALILFVTVIGPVFEEIFFRGFLYRTLRKYLGVFWGLFINGIIFSLIHNNVMAFLPIVLLGVILGALVEKTSSLVPSIIMHITVNTVSVLMVLSLAR